MCSFLQLSAAFTFGATIHCDKCYIPVHLDQLLQGLVLSSAKLALVQNQAAHSPVEATGTEGRLLINGVNTLKGTVRF